MAQINIYAKCENYSDVEVFSKEEVQQKFIEQENDFDIKLEEKSNTDHEHTYASLTNKPNTFPPSEHNHDERYFTETELNNKFNSYKKNSDLITVSGQISLAGGSGSVTIPYPEGFNLGNCIPLAPCRQYSVSNNQLYDYYTSSAMMFYNPRLTPNGITFLCTPIAQDAGPTGNYIVKVTLLKV